MYERHELTVIEFDEQNMFVNADKSDGGSTGWDQFSVEPEVSDI